MDSFEEIFTLEDIGKSKKEDLLEFYLNKHNILSKNSVLIGDRDVDYNAAKINHMPFIFCNYGHAPKDEVLDFNIMVDNCFSLLEAVDKI